MAGWDACERWLFHVPHGGSYPDEVTKFRATPTAADVQDGNQRPERMCVTVEIVASSDGLAVHYNHVLSSYGDQVLYPYTTVIVVQAHQGPLTLLRVNTCLGVAREPGIDSSTCNEDLLGFCDDNSPRLIASAGGTSGVTRVVWVPFKIANYPSERSRWRRTGLKVGGLGLEHTGEDVGGIMEIVLVENGMFGRCSIEPASRQRLPHTGKVSLRDLKRKGVNEVKGQVRAFQHVVTLRVRR